MPSSRCLFQLAPLEPRTDGTGFSLSEEEEMILLQTPTTVQTDEPPERMRARAERNGYKNGTKFGSLTSQIKYDERVALMLKTPCAMDCSGDTRKSKGISGTSGTLAQEIASGYATRVRGLEIPMLLPTPLVVEREHPERVEALKATGATKINSRANGEQRPNGIVDFMNFYDLLATPTVMEDRRRIYGEKAMNEERSAFIEHNLNPYHIEKMAGMERGAISADKDGVHSRLSPLFTEEMMGFPFLWTTLPFLRPSGAPKPSKPTATP